MASSKTLWKLTAGALLSLAAQPALPSHPSHLVEGIRAYENGQFKQAYSVFASHADTTNPKALYYLSALYLSGKGVDQDEFKAFEYCKMAAEEGLAEAQFNLGVLHFEGNGVEQNLEEAKEQKSDLDKLQTNRAPGDDAARAAAEGVSRGR